MPILSTSMFGPADALPSAEQLLHGLHFMICCFAVLIACVPMATAKGSPEHKFAGMIYLPVSLAALLLATFMAWRETSFILFCFNAFCAYLLLSGWRAVHEGEKPALIDMAIPFSLLALGLAVGCYALTLDDGMRSFYLICFSLNAFYLFARDLRHLRRRFRAHKQRVFFAGMDFGAAPMGWLNRHAAGMIGSVMANVSVIVLTLLPVELHWLWPVTLLALGAWIAWREREKKMRVHRVLAPVLQTGRARAKPPKPQVPPDDVRKAA